MGYVYCRKCGWSQDDFWSWRYNPPRVFLSYLRTFWRPAMIRCDKPPRRQFSWMIVLRQAWRAFNPARYWRQTWWTWRSWKRAIDNATAAKGERCWPNCPRCKADELNTD